MADIQRLGAGDLTALRALNAIFADAFEDPESYANQPPSDAYLERLLASESNVALVASEIDDVVGGLTAYRLDKFEQARSEFCIYDLAVAAAYRRFGVASRLIAALQHIAHESGAWSVYVQADYADPPAVALYSTLGTREDVINFDLPVVRR